MLEHYALHYIKKSKGKLVKYGEIKDHFKNWAIGNIGHAIYYKNNCLKLLYAYTSKNYICNANSIFDIEIMDNDNTPHYKINYNILDHYTEDLKTLYQLNNVMLLLEIQKYLFTSIRNQKLKIEP